MSPETSCGRHAASPAIRAVTPSATTARIRWSAPAAVSAVQGHDRRAIGRRQVPGRQVDAVGAADSHVLVGQASPGRRRRAERRRRNVGRVDRHPERQQDELCHDERGRDGEQSPPPVGRPDGLRGARDKQERPGPEHDQPEYRGDGPRCLGHIGHSQGRTGAHARDSRDNGTGCAYGRRAESVPGDEQRGRGDHEKSAQHRPRWRAVRYDKCGQRDALHQQCHRKDSIGSHG